MPRCWPTRTTSIRSGRPSRTPACGRRCSGRATGWRPDASPDGVPSYHEGMDEVPSLAPSLLLSMPQMNDPNFERTVVLLCQHSADGAFGLVVNRPVVTTAKVVAAEHPEQSAEHELEIWIGGPVEPERSWILLHDSAPDGQAVRVCEGVFLSTSAGVLQRIIEHSADPRTRLIAGYAGWGPGQLDAE